MFTKRDWLQFSLTLFVLAFSHQAKAMHPKSKINTLIQTTKININPYVNRKNILFDNYKHFKKNVLQGATLTQRFPYKYLKQIYLFSLQSAASKFTQVIHKECPNIIYEKFDNVYLNSGRYGVVEIVLKRILFNAMKFAEKGEREYLSKIIFYQVALGSTGKKVFSKIDLMSGYH
ncbi:MAG: hypothetical protein AAF310_06090 [Myxococcota bacterium]